MAKSEWAIKIKKIIFRLYDATKGNGDQKFHNVLLVRINLKINLVRV